MAPRGWNCNHAVIMVYPRRMKGGRAMSQLIAGNWKMNGLTESAGALATALRGAAGDAAATGTAELLVCPPATQLAHVGRILAGSVVRLGGQDCHMAASGAHTGDVSAAMLRDVGATYVILGHSERRQNHGEIDETVREKVLAARACGLIPIVCVGETLEQRERGEDTNTVGWQLKGSLPDGYADGVGVVAYEPIWAIGTGKTATPGDVETMHRFVRDELVRQFGEAGRQVRILYGGSVKAGNAAGLLRVPEVSGALVGGASLDAAEFLSIWRAAGSAS